MMISKPTSLAINSRSFSNLQSTANSNMWLNLISLGVVPINSSDFVMVVLFELMIATILSTRLQYLVIYGITILFFPGEAGVQRLVDNIVAIISSNKTTITKSLELIGTTPSEIKFNHIFEFAVDCKFEKLREFIAKEVGLEIIIESLGWIKSYDFFGSEGYLVNYLRTKDLCNNKYFTNFKCNQCVNTFDIMSKISSIGRVRDNIESSVSRHLIPCKCKSCGSTTSIIERLSGQFETITVLLPIKLSHIAMKTFQYPKSINSLR